jgi:hypothetical protein
MMQGQANRRGLFRILIGSVLGVPMNAGADDSFPPLSAEGEVVLERETPAFARAKRDFEAVFDNAPLTIMGMQWTHSPAWGFILRATVVLYDDGAESPHIVYFARWWNDIDQDGYAIVPIDQVKSH